MKTVNDILTPFPKLILTFGSLRLLRNAKASWYRFKIKEYIPLAKEMLLLSVIWSYD